MDLYLYKVHRYHALTIIRRLVILEPFKNRLPVSIPSRRYVLDGTDYQLKLDCTLMAIRHMADQAVSFLHAGLLHFLLADTQRLQGRYTGFLISVRFENHL